MKTGSFFEIGKSHNVCEDYAMHTDNAVVCSDGCSNGHGSPIDSDWGSRILSHLSLKYLHILQAEGDHKQEFIQKVISHGAAVCDTLSKNMNCLTATLLMAYEKGDLIKTLRVGDGIIGAKYKDGSISFSIIDYNKNAPFYPIYAASPKTINDFFKNFGTRAVQRIYFINEDTDEGWANCKCHELEWDYSDNPYLVQEYKKEEVQFVFLGSDGWEQFVEHVVEGNSKYPKQIELPEIVRQIIDFGNFNRNFVQHQCNWMLKLDKPGTFIRRGWETTDDFSMGAIYCGKVITVTKENDHES